MTPYETAMRLMRQRNGTTGHPDFVVAYLRQEASRTKDGNPLRLSPNPDDRARDAEVRAETLRDTITAFLSDCDPDDMWVAAWLQMRADDLERKQCEY